VSCPLSVLIVEDEVLQAVELGFLLEEAGCAGVGHALDSAGAIELACARRPDLALVDVHLQDGPTGIETARRLARELGVAVLFLTANVKRLPEDFAGACGAIGKPYSERAVTGALDFLRRCLSDGRAPGPAPRGLVLSRAWSARWRLPELAEAS
jgi:CheY-like chemotaxis protein